ncbi:MAG: hypothetical protein L7G96_08025, partial [Vulcanisaeta sp.]|nr:hypothetical protein [Vulcanisaeta sp.]
GGVEVGNLHESVKASVSELLDTATGEAELVHAVSLIVAIRAFFESCKVFDDLTTNRVINAIDDAITIKENGTKRLRVPHEILIKAHTSVPTAEELRAVLLKTFVLSVAKPLTIATLKELARKGKITVVFDARRHRYQITFKLPNLFTDTESEIIIPISFTTVNTVLKYGDKVDEKPKRGKKAKEEDINPLFDRVPGILEPYVGLFLKAGWVPAFSSFEFVKFLLELESKDQAAYNTTRDELRAILLKALRKFKFAKVVNKEGSRLYDPLVVDNPKGFVFVDDATNELIVPSRFYAELEVASGYKSALANLLQKQGILKVKHTTYVFARRDDPNNKIVLDVTVFDLERLKELLGFDPQDMMSKGEIDIASLVELKEGEARGDENAETQ